MDIHICKLPISDSDSFCTLQSEWDNTEIRIFVLHQNKGWSGKFQLGKEENLAELLDQLSISEEKYMEETKSALTTNGGLENFTYSMDSNTFTWKKCMRKNMVVKFGYVCLSEASTANTYQTVIDSSLRLNHELAEKLSRSTHQTEHLSSENSFLKEKISNLTKQKIEMEETLYNQFLYLLNEKKKKIAELIRKIDSHGDNAGPFSDTVESDVDPFDTDTELDSDEGEHVSPSKVSVQAKNSLDEEDFNFETLPKKTRRAQKQTDIAPGPSGISRLHSAKLSNDKKTSPTPEKKLRCKNPPLFGDLDKVSSEEEDPFAFPKRSKRVQKQVKLDNPSNTVKYESDSESPPVDNTVKIEADSDRTPSELDFGDIDVKSGKLDELKSDQNDKTVEKAELARTSDSYDGFSSSTRAMLDRLI